MRYLLDTDTLVYWLKGEKNIEAKALQAGLGTLGLSIITKSELYFGAYHSAYVDRNLDAIEQLSQTLTVIPFDDDAAKQFGSIKAKLMKAGTLVKDADLMIGATAIVRNMTVVTNNTRHFEKIPDLRIINWA